MLTRDDNRSSINDDDDDRDGYCLSKKQKRMLSLPMTPGIIWMRSANNNNINNNYNNRDHDNIT